MSEPLPLQMVCEMARSIPCSPWLLPQLLKALDDPDISNKEIEGIIRKDTGLATATLKLANSAFFSRSRACDSLEDAIFRMGHREVHKLAVSSVAVRWLSNQINGYGWEPGDLCRHSVCVAAASQVLANATRLAKPETAYTAGLFHDVGKLALAYACADQFEIIRQQQAQTQCSWRQAELDILGYDHTSVGGALLESWNFPIELIEVVLYYSRPSLAAAAHRQLVTLIHAAKHLAINIGQGVGEDGFRTELDEESLHAEGFTPEFLESQLPIVLVEAEKLLAAEA